MRLKTLRLAAIWSPFLFLTFLGCDDSEPVESTPPLRPLTYTEHPDITPEAAAVRERRLLRRLNAGAASGWGTLEVDANSRLSNRTPEQLGKNLTNALLKQDARLWDQVFVSPVDYANLVHVDLDSAKTFVDEIQGSSAAVWSAFLPPLESEMVEGGLPVVFEFDRLELGSGRGLDGKTAEGEEIQQYWNTTLVWRFQPQPDVEVLFTIPKIVKTSGKSGETWSLASKITMGNTLKMLLEAGLHLKPELLRNDEYPYPLKVGNFWRYRREYQTAEGSPQATESLLEVLAVDLHGPLRVVTLRRSLNDENLTKQELKWVLTPRRIYECGRQCRRELPALQKLLPLFSKQRPFLKFPIEASHGVEGPADIDTPAGHFSNLITLEMGEGGAYACPTEDEPERICTVDPPRHTFSPGRGTIERRVMEAGTRRWVKETLVDYRLVP